MNFQDLPLIQPLQKALQNEDFTLATEIQAAVLPFALKGRDILGSAQTGSGKTLAFALPILDTLYRNNSEEEKEYAEMVGTLDEKERKKAKKERKNNPRKIQSLILAPTRELAIQIGESFTPYSMNTNLKHTVIYGGRNQFHQVKALEKGVDILIATPGRLLDLMEQGFVHLSNIEIFTLDEADKMLEMGFLEDIEKVIKKLPKEKQTLFFSATMPPKIEKLAQKLLTDPERITIERVGSVGEGVKQEVFFLDQAQKRQLLQHTIKREDLSSIIVFVKTKDDTETVLDYVKSAGVTADHIHRNRSQNARQGALEKLKTGEIKVLVATDIASRGIDVDNLSCVINYDLPQDEETYVHRIGRTARAGKKGLSISFCIPAQVDKLRRIEKLIGKELPVNTSIDYKKEVVVKSKVIGSYSMSGINNQERRGPGKEKKARKRRCS